MAFKGGAVPASVRKRRAAKLLPLYLVLNEFNDDLRCFQWVRLYTTRKFARLCARAQKPRGRIVEYAPHERKGKRR